MDKSKILTLLAEECQVDLDVLINIDENANLIEEINFNSLSFVSFVVKLEIEFGVEIKDSDLIIDKFETLKSMFETISPYVDFNGTSIIKKCIVLDCDDVLWKGVAGEEHIIIDDNVRTFHKLLEDLYKQGIFLCLCTRNQEKIIEDIFADKISKINYSMISVVKYGSVNKANSLIEIANELNIDFNSIVFADDSEYELGYVYNVLPDITTIKVDYSNLSFIDEIRMLFDLTPISSLNRTKLYHEQKEREKDKLLPMSIEEYNNLLETEVTCRKAIESEIFRLSELSMRANQFNLSNAHYSVEDLKDIFDSSEYTIISLSVKDKYGDMGIVGLAVINGNVIEAFILSCRAFGRGFEYILLDKIRVLFDERLKGEYKNNEKNQKFSNFYYMNGVETIFI